MSKTNNTDTRAESGDSSGSNAASPINWPTLLLMLSGTFMTVLDFFIVNVALPSIQTELKATAGAVQFVIAGYGLAFAAGLVTGGRLGDIYGRRRMFSIGLALFTLASVLCGLAPDIRVLVGARILQGVSAAMLQPQVLAMLGTMYKGPQRATAFSAYGLSLGLGAVLGQLIGGALIEADIAGLGWRTCFLINLPVGAIVLLLTPKLIPSFAPQRTARLDLVGMLLAAVASVAVILPLVEGRQQGWPAWSLVCLAAALPLFLLFVSSQKWIAKRGGDPLIAPALLAQRSFVLGLIITLVFYSGNASFYLVLALYLQQGMGLAPLASGFVFTLLAVGFFSTTMAGPRIATALGQYSIAYGAALLAGAYVWLYASVAFAPIEQTVSWMVPGLVAAGAGIGMVMAPLTSTVLAGVSPQYAGVGSGVLAMLMQAGNALGVALIGILFYGALNERSDRAAYDDAIQAGLLFLITLTVIVAALFPYLKRVARHTAVQPLHLKPAGIEK